MSVPAGNRLKPPGEGQKAAFGRSKRVRTTHVHVRKPFSRFRPQPPFIGDCCSYL